MKHFTTVAVCCIAFAALSVHAQAQAQDVTAKSVIGPYIGAAAGASFGNREIDDADSRNDEGLGHSGKLFGGYQWTEHFGVQAGYVRLQDLNQNTGSGATLVKQTATGQSIYVAGTGRLPLGNSFALTGKLGVSSGKVTGVSPTTAATNALLGSKTSLLVGTGVDYLLTQQVQLSLELESYGKISDRVKGNTLTLGTRFRF